MLVVQAMGITWLSTAATFSKISGFPKRELRARHGQELNAVHVLVSLTDKLT